MPNKDMNTLKPIFLKQPSYANANLFPQHTLVFHFLMLPAFLLSLYLRHF